MTGYEICYECEGKRRCPSCRGIGRHVSGERCGQCSGHGRCAICNGEGELVVAGSRKRIDRSGGGSTVRRIGRFRELGFAEAPSLREVRGKRSPAHKRQVVAYLRSGAIMVASPGLHEDAFAPGVIAGRASIRTDGDYAWPDSLAYYVAYHDVELPADFERHMAGRQWTPPVRVDLAGLKVI